MHKNHVNGMFQFISKKIEKFSCMRAYKPQNNILDDLTICPRLHLVIKIPSDDLTSNDLCILCILSQGLNLVMHGLEKEKEARKICHYSHTG